MESITDFDIEDFFITDLDFLLFHIQLLGTSETGRSDGSHCVYVVRLSEGVLEKRKFIHANPDRDPYKECLYVGLTGLTPAERFGNHKANHKASRWVRDYGIELMPHLYTVLNRMPYDVAKEMEVKLAEMLREHGYAVWQH